MKGKVKSLLKDPNIQGFAWKWEPLTLLTDDYMYVGRMFCKIIQERKSEMFDIFLHVGKMLAQEKC